MLRINFTGRAFLASIAIVLSFTRVSMSHGQIETFMGSDENVLSLNAEGPSNIETSGNIRIATFRDNVVFRQGLIEIIGDTARLEQDLETGDLIKVTVEGQPARFTRAAENSVEAITGHSASIVYYNEPDTDTGTDTDTDTVQSIVEFIGEANFNQGRTAFQCSQIRHTIESGATESPGPCSGILAPVAPNTSTDTPRD